MPSISPTSQGGEQIVGTASALASSSQSIQSRNAILVSHNQKGNPLLKHIRNMRWAFADVVCGDLLGQNSCALYLSIRELQKNFMLRVVLCHVDVEDVVKPLLEVTKTALLHDCTLLCTWRSFACHGCINGRHGSLPWHRRVQDQVKCLYDTFHKPFKRVVSSHPPIPKTPFLKDVEPSSVNEVTEVEKDTKERKQM
ncbi:DNA excision repair protein ERCC-1 [Citrus sinensis]|uniref:DNA excision repair protein ERCC-1 n=1 Tax=Citrus sinensis TaxID=2711 RepID=A0ACB8KKS9_CITSI|nr:DNA excision repair protein ERCC-1 [Citrus sinensis]